MFEVEVGDNTYKVEFHHFLEAKKQRCFPPGTTCQILDFIGMTFAAGHTTLNLSDNYDRNFGRKLALRRALKKGGFTRDQRILFWNEYFRTRNQKEEQEWII